MNPISKIKKSKKIKTPVKKFSAARSAEERKKDGTENLVEELFGVRITGEADIENHFGDSDKKPGGEASKKDAPGGESKTDE